MSWLVASTVSCIRGGDGLKVIYYPFADVAFGA